MKVLKIMIEPSARRDIKHLDKTIQRRVIAALDDFSEGNTVDIRKMQGTGTSIEFVSQIAGLSVEEVGDIQN